MEPAVLASAKEYLQPDRADPGYAVVDCQFRTDTWGNTEIPIDIQNRLQPINSLLLASGQPDALVAPPKTSVFRGDLDQSINALPLAVLEAKGASPSGSRPDRNATRVAITQAHGHLGETNVGFAAVPSGSITDQDHSLARELNVGLIAVDTDSVELVEKPRLVGIETTATTDTVRFHAQLGETAVERLSKNHPKNAIGYSLSMAHDEPTEEVFKRYVIDSANDARLDSEALGLVARSVSGNELTPLAREAVRTIWFHYGGLESALEAIADQTGSSARFIRERPIMGAVARDVLLNYPPTQLLIDTIQELIFNGESTPTLGQVAKAVAEKRPSFAVDLFVSPRPMDRNRVFSDDEARVLELEAFDIGEIYSTQTTYQYKAMLYHAGLVTERGVDKKSEIDPLTDVWSLETPLAM